METSSDLLSNNGGSVETTPKRWFVLGTYIIFAAANSFQWVEYSIITNIIVKYYGVSEESVDCTSLLYTGLYAVLVFPATYIVKKKGLRTAFLLAGLGTALGTAIKLFSTSRHTFWVVLLGQTFLGASQVIICCLPARISSVWFKADEVSLACALGVVGTQLGVGLGFVFPPIVVKNHANPDLIGGDLKILCWTLTAVMVPVAVAVLFFVPNRPKEPPSITQARERNKDDVVVQERFVDSLKDLLRNGPFVLHLMAYALSDGVTNSLNTLLNQNVLHYFPVSIASRLTKNIRLLPT